MIPVQQDPPRPHPRTYRRWSEILATPALNPGVWWLVEQWPDRTPARSAAHHLKTGASRHPSGDWDFAVRKQADGTHGLYARCNNTTTCVAPCRIVSVTDYGSFT